MHPTEGSPHLLPDADSVFGPPSSASASTLWALSFSLKVFPSAAMVTVNQAQTTSTNIKHCNLICG